VAIASMRLTYRLIGPMLMVRATRRHPIQTWSVIGDSRRTYPVASAFAAARVGGIDVVIIMMLGISALTVAVGVVSRGRRHRLPAHNAAKRAGQWPDRYPFDPRF
jgi:hypothetical protein